MEATIFHGHPDQVQDQLQNFLSLSVVEEDGRDENGVVKEKERAKKIHHLAQSESAEGVEFVKTITITILWD